MSAVFVSYSHHDRGRVADIIAGLKRSEVAVWWDRDLPPGQTWDDQIEDALETASAVIIVWSRQAVASPNVKDEAHYAREEKKALPVRIEDVTPPFRFRRLQWIDLFATPAEANSEWSRLVAEIRRRLDRGPDPGSSDTSKPEAPPVPSSGGIAVRCKMVLPAAIVALGLMSNIASTVAFGGQNRAFMAVSWFLGGVAVAAAIFNLIPERGIG